MMVGRITFGPVLPDNILTKMTVEDRARLGKAGKTAAECRSEAIVKDEKEIQKAVANYLRLLNLWHDQDGMHKRRTGTLGSRSCCRCQLMLIDQEDEPRMEVPHGR